MKKLDIIVPATEQGAYKITIGTRLLHGLLDSIRSDFGTCKPFVVTDQNLVQAGHLDTLLGSRDLPSYVIDPPGEISKTIQTTVAIIEAMEKAYLGRDSLVIALGGGTVGDIAGFAAAVFKRGIPVIQVPTTSLAQADSAVGGKTGVDSSLSKNAFGAFWHPHAVCIDVDTLITLNERDYRAGLVESIKHGIIADIEYFTFLEENLDAILQRQPEVLIRIAEINCQIKGHVVQIDPREKNMRRILNYGHTIGHAVESASHYELLHGESVAIGIMGACLIEVEMGVGDSSRLSKIKNILTRLGVPTCIPRAITVNSLMDLIKRDKKAIDKWPKFVLTKGLGQVQQESNQWAVSVEQRIVEKVLQTLY
jgi:3-dehydroquinate synthase